MVYTYANYVQLTIHSRLSSDTLPGILQKKKKNLQSLKTFTKCITEMFTERDLSPINQHSPNPTKRRQQRAYAKFVPSFDIPRPSSTINLLVCALKTTSHCNGTLIYNQRRSSGRCFCSGDERCAALVTEKKSRSLV